MPTTNLDKAKRIVEKLTKDDHKRLRQCVAQCMAMAVQFDETGKHEYLVGLRENCEQLIRMLKDFEQRIS